MKTGLLLIVNLLIASVAAAGSTVVDERSIRTESLHITTSQLVSLPLYRCEPFKATGTETAHLVQETKALRAPYASQSLTAGQSTLTFTAPTVTRETQFNVTLHEADGTLIQDTTIIVYPVKASPLAQWSKQNTLLVLSSNEQLKQFLKLNLISFSTFMAENAGEPDLILTDNLENQSSYIGKSTIIVFKPEHDIPFISLTKDKQFSLVKVHMDILSQLLSNPVAVKLFEKIVAQALNQESDF